MLTNKLSAVGIFCDADKQGPQERFDNIIRKITECDAFSDIALPGQVSKGSPRAGVFIFPDNNSCGNLETVLLKCAEISFPGLLKGATTFVSGVEGVYKNTLPLSAVLPDYERVF